MCRVEESMDTVLSSEKTLLLDTILQSDFHYYRLYISKIFNVKQISIHYFVPEEYI